ncbi:MAG TPA: response regulator [Bryobacteraceae bacterium]|jgi:two-component system cell cycle response regulator|nr:response regulator [Bryobacteraceae bacterium]
MAGRILIIEDNAANLELMVYLLEAYGHTAIAAADGRTGVGRACEEAPDLILCDIQLPDIDGYEVIRQLKDIPALRGIPRVAVTAMAMVGDRDKLLAAGFDGYIGKPIQPETLVQEVEAFMPGNLASQRAAVAVSPPAAIWQERPSERDLATILLVDDTAANIDLGRTILESAGYKVIVAGDVGSALEVARLTRPNLILSDVDMPRRDGYDLLKSLSEDAGLRSIPFVFLSSTSSVLKLGHPLQRLGFPVKFLVRPIDPQSLLAEIQSSLHEPARDPS